MADPTHVVVDGSNIATEGRAIPSLAQLEEAVEAFLIEHPRDRITVVVDATFGHRIDESERARYERMVTAGELIAPPAGAIGRGDAFVLQIADKANATVFSNDSFQEFHGDYPWLFDEGRLIGGKPVEHVGWIFLARTPVRGPTSRRSVRATRRSKPAAAGTKAAPTRRAAAKRAEPVEARAEPEAEPSAPGPPAARKGAKPEPINDPLPFIEFVGKHPVGNEVDGVVERFVSHGAHVLIEGVRCYIPLKHLGDPAPRRARDVLTLGATERFVIDAIDTPRRGIDLRMAPARSADTDEAEPEEPKARTTRRRTKAKADTDTTDTDTDTDTDTEEPKKTTRRRTKAKADTDTTDTEEPKKTTRRRTKAKTDTDTTDAEEPKARTTRRRTKTDTDTTDAEEPKARTTRRRTKTDTDTDTEEPKARTTRRRTKTDTDTDAEEPKARTTRRRTKTDTDTTDAEEPKARTTRRRTKTDTDTTDTTDADGSNSSSGTAKARKAVRRSKTASGAEIDDAASSTSSRTTTKTKKPRARRTTSS